MSRAARRQMRFVVVFLIVVALFMATFRMGLVRGDSMLTTYESGQVVLVRRRNWFSGPLRRGDVILARKDRDVIIKRIHRLPGEELDDGFPYVRAVTMRNGLGDYYEQQTVREPDGLPRTRYTVPDGYIVLLGDNLRGSEDSRFFGPVPIRDVLGVVVNAPPPPYSEAAPIAPRAPRSPSRKPAP